MSSDPAALPRRISQLPRKPDSPDFGLRGLGQWQVVVQRHNVKVTGGREVSFRQACMNF
jgi:hypothetical protein